MKYNHFYKTKAGVRPIGISLLAALVCALLIFAPGESFSSPQRKKAPPVQESYEVVRIAQVELERIPRERIEDVKDPELRGALQRAVIALEEVANNRNRSQLPLLLNNLGKQVQELEHIGVYKGVLESKGGKCGSKYQTCQGGCKAKGKKLGGCFAKMLGCLTIRLIDKI